MPAWCTPEQALELQQFQAGLLGDVSQVRHCRAQRAGQVAALISESTQLSVPCVLHLDSSPSLLGGGTAAVAL